MRRSWWVALGALVVLTLAPTPSAQPQASSVLGGQKAAFDLVPYRDGTFANFTESHRQDLCPRYEEVRRGDLPLSDALKGLQLRPLFARGLSLEYSDTDGINVEYPGLPATLMDVLAERAGFTWRQSFAVHTMAPYYNLTWTELLWWGVNAYDLAVLNWDHSLERMELGIVFVEPFYDGSIVLVDKPRQGNQDGSNGAWDKDAASNLWNWTRPFEFSVWMLIIATIVASALVHQLIESLHEERQDRPLGQWLQDNLYLSTLNFTQNFEYAPSSGPGRVFAVSMSIWSLVIVATYTANLASLFVEDHEPVFSVQTIDEAAHQRIPVCTLLDSNSDDLIKTRYRSVLRRPKVTEQELYRALRAGECRLAADSRSSWERFRGMKRYNPDCSLATTGIPVAEIRSGFAVKGDVGHRCSGLVQQVLNLYFVELIEEGVLEQIWEAHHTRQQDWDCDRDPPGPIGYNEEEEEEENSSKDDNSRRLQSNTKRRRELKGAARGGSSRGASGESFSDASTGHSLTLPQMMGTFVLHYSLMLVAVIATFASPYWTRLTRYWGWPQAEPLVIRTHGPTIGAPPSGFRDSTGSVIRAYGSPIMARYQHRQSAILRSSLPASHRNSNNTMTMDESSRVTGHLRINTRVLPRKSTKKGVEASPATTTNDVFYNEEEPKVIGMEQSMTVIPEDNRYNNSSDTAPPEALARLKEHFDTELQRTQERVDDKMEQVVAMLTEMKHQDQQFRKEVFAALALQMRKTS